MSDLLGLWPIALIGAIVGLRCIRQDSLADRVLAELLDAAANVATIAAGVGFGLLFGARVL